MLKILLFLFIICSHLSAQEILEGKFGEFLEKIDGSLGVSYSSDFKNQKDTEAEASSAMEMLLKYNLIDSNEIRLFGSITQQQNQGRETEINDGFLAWANDEIWFRDDNTRIGQQVRLAIPLSKNSIDRDQKTTGITLASRLLHNLAPIGLDRVTLTYMPSFTKNFHKYKVNRAFRTNDEYVINQLINLSWDITDHYFLSTDFSYKNKWSYEGTKKDDGYSYKMYAGTNLIKSLIITAGITTESLIQSFENGNDKNITLFDNKESNYFVELSYLF